MPQFHCQESHATIYFADRGCGCSNALPQSNVNNEHLAKSKGAGSPAETETCTMPETQSPVVVGASSLPYARALIRQIWVGAFFCAVCLRAAHKHLLPNFICLVANNAGSKRSRN